MGSARQRLDAPIPFRIAPQSPSVQIHTCRSSAAPVETKMGTPSSVPAPKPQPATKHVQTKTQRDLNNLRGGRRDRATVNKHNEITIALGIDYTPRTRSTTVMGLGSIGSC
jgi:hypothetical protein